MEKNIIPVNSALEKFLYILIIGVIASNPLSAATINSVVNPGYKDKQYSKILVAADVGVLSIQNKLEFNTIDQLKKEGFNGMLLSAYNIVFPPLTWEKLKMTAEKNDADGVLVLSVTNHNLVNGSSSTNGTITQNTDNDYSYDSSTYKKSTLYVSFTADLVDVSTEKTAWHGESTVSASTADEVNNMYSSFATAVAEELKDKNILDVAGVSGTTQGSPNNENGSSDIVQRLESGFRGLSWGDPLPNSMEPLDKKGDMDGYVRPNEPKPVFGFDSDYVGYYFSNGKFCRVEMGWGFNASFSDDQKTQLTKTLISGWGQPSEIDAAGAYHWKSEDGKFTAMLSDINEGKFDKSHDCVMDLLIEASDFRTRVEKSLKPNDISEDESVENDDPKKQLELGAKYHEGIGVKKDLKKAFYWYKKSAEQGNATAQDYLGNMYDEEAGNICVKNNGKVTKNATLIYKEAFAWFRKSADQGNDDALYSLGDYYFRGDGVEPNIKKAISFYEQAAHKCNPNAIYWLKVLRSNNPHEFDDNDVESPCSPEDIERREERIQKDL